MRAVCTLEQYVSDGLTLRRLWPAPAVHDDRANHFQGGAAHNVMLCHLRFQQDASDSWGRPVLATTTTTKRTIMPLHPDMATKKPRSIESSPTLRPRALKPHNGQTIQRERL